MPLYDFRCPHCRHEFEKLCKDGETQVCPMCATAAERLMSTFSFRMKEHYPGWVDNLDNYQKEKADKGIDPELPGFNKIKNREFEKRTF